MKNLIVLLFLFNVLIGFSQDVQQNGNFNPNIKSIQLFKPGNELGGAFAELRGGQLVLNFDELGTEYKNYQYTLVHCNADWTPSSLLQQEYIDGYYEDYITNYATSFNAQQDYLHYTQNIPNDNMKLKKSGNYLLKVYEVGKADAPTFQMRMVIFESMTRITPMIKRSDLVQERENFQEIDFTLIPPFTVGNPYTDIKVSILQNRRWDNMISGLTATFVRENELIFNYDRKSSFPGGNEYRQIDLSTLRYQTARVAKILTTEGMVKIKLINDIPRYNYPYSQYQDLNGGFIVKNDDGQQTPNTDGDYCQVTFTLPMKDPISTGVIYVAGDFNQYRYSEEYQMRYNYQIGAYEATMMIKQGVYNYQYMVVTDKQAPSMAPIEGSFFNTENDYTMLVYYRDFATDFDRVVGCYTANSLRGN